MRAFDASSIIYGWDNYPIAQFPRLWAWMAGEVRTGNLGLRVVAMTELQDKTPDCGQWLQDNEVQVLPASNAALREALQIKAHLGIANDQYHADGVGENDIIIVSVCRVMGLGLMSDENRQPQLPLNLRRYKIPAVCEMPQVNVNCINCLDFIKQSGQVFG